MATQQPLARRTYEVTLWRVNAAVRALKAAGRDIGRDAGRDGGGDDGPIPVLLYQRTDLPGPKPAVVYYHGVVQSKEAYLDTHPMARRLADAGFVVALPDAPGHGERPGGASLVARLRESLPREFCADIEQAADEAPALLDWLAARPEVDGGRLGVLGVSMGGFTAAVVAARARDRLRAAVCIAGSGDLLACMAATDSIAPGKWGPLDRAIDSETRQRIARIDPLGYPERYPPLPLLILHGERDTWNPRATSERFAELVAPHYARSPELFRMVVAAEAPHWPPHPGMIRDAVDWLVRFVKEG